MNRLAEALVLAGILVSIGAPTAQADPTDPTDFYCTYLKTWAPEQYAAYAPCSW